MKEYPHRLLRGFCALLLLAACAQERSQNTAVEEAEANVTDPSWLTSEGWNGVTVGMTRQEVIDVLGEDANPEAVGGPDPEACDEFRPERAPAGMLLMIEQGRLTRITLSTGTEAEVETEGGFVIGDSATEVKSYFGSRIVATPHKYWPAPAEYLTVWTVAPPAADPRGVVYEVGPDGLVEHIHAGGASIQYVEGCL